MHEEQLNNISLPRIFNFSNFVLVDDSLEFNIFRWRIQNQNHTDIFDTLNENKFEMAFKQNSISTNIWNLLVGKGIDEVS